MALLYKMIVAYDGSRFNGFQRQMTNSNMMKQQQQQRQQAGQNKNNQRNSSFVPKRPHWDSCSGHKQKTTCTIQECLEDAISNWTGQTVEEIALRFSGRTDKGVHARGQVIAVNLSRMPLSSSAAVAEPAVVERQPTASTGVLMATPAQLHPQSQQQQTLPKSWEIQNAINSRLPIDISIVQVDGPTTTPFHPRHYVACKQYSYTLKFRRKVFCSNSSGTTSSTSSNELLPICRSGYPNTFRHALDDSPCVWVVPWALDDVSHMHRLCEFLQGRHDFSAFVHKHNRDVGNHELTLNKMQYVILSESTSTNNKNNCPEKDEPEDELLAPVVMARLVFESKGFRRGMVRNLVGFCVDVCRGLDQVTDMDWNDLWTKKEAASKVHAAPPFGLCLEWVQYHEEQNHGAIIDDKDNESMNVMDD